MRIDFENFDPSRQTVLCLRSHQFERDIQALRLHGSRYNWADIDEMYIAGRLAKWLPMRLRQQSRYVNEHGPDVDEAWAKAKQLGIAILDQLRGVKVAAVMSSNFDYWNDEGMRLACKERGIPFLVLMREFEVHEDRHRWHREYWSEMERIPDVAGLAVAGPLEIEMLDTVGVYPASIMRATGWPRLDVWLTPTQPIYDGPMVLLSYLKGYDADAHFWEMLIIFAEAAKRHPHIRFLVKAKHQPEVLTIKKMLAERGLDLHVEDSAVFPSLVKNARAIIGFNSMALFESLLAPVPILVPSWGETDKPAKFLHVSPKDPVMGNHMQFVTGADEMARVLDRAATGPVPTLDMAARLAAFQHYFTYDPVQKASERVENFVAEFTGGVGR